MQFLTPEIMLSTDDLYLSCLHPRQREKISLNSYFDISLWYPKRLYEDLKASIKPSEARQESVKQKFELIFILIHLSEMRGVRRVNNNL